MEVEYRITYKCRLCGEEFGSGVIKNREVVVTNVSLVASGEEAYGFHPTYPHHCNETDIGMADFIGVKGYEV